MSIKKVRDFEDLLKSHDGYNDSIYLNAKQKSCFGVGHRISQEDPEWNAKIGSKVDSGRIKEALDNDISNAIDIARSQYPDFTDYPVQVQHVLADMAFNLGSQKLASFNAFGIAIKNKNWKVSALSLATSTWATEQEPSRADNLVALLKQVDDKDSESSSSSSDEEDEDKEEEAENSDKEEAKDGDKEEESKDEGSDKEEEDKDEGSHKEDDDDKDKDSDKEDDDNSSKEEDDEKDKGSDKEDDDKGSKEEDDDEDKDSDKEEDDQSSKEEEVERDEPEEPEVEEPELEATELEEPELEKLVEPEAPEAENIADQVLERLMKCCSCGCFRSD